MNILIYLKSNEVACVLFIWTYFGSSILSTIKAYWIHKSQRLYSSCFQKVFWISRNQNLSMIVQYSESFRLAPLTINSVLSNLIILLNTLHFLSGYFSCISRVIIYIQVTLDHPSSNLLTRLYYHNVWKLFNFILLISTYFQSR